MPQNSSQYPPLLLLASFFLICGLLILPVPLLFQLAAGISKGIFLIGTALICYGVGEILNHPKELIRQPFQENREMETGPELYRRRRNVCGLGNLAIIISLLLFFIGMSAILFR